MEDSLPIMPKTLSKPKMPYPTKPDPKCRRNAPPPSPSLRPWRQHLLRSAILDANVFFDPQSRSQFQPPGFNSAACRVWRICSCFGVRRRLRNPSALRSSSANSSIMGRDANLLLVTVRTWMPICSSRSLRSASRSILSAFAWNESLSYSTATPAERHSKSHFKIEPIGCWLFRAFLTQPFALSRSIPESASFATPRNDPGSTHVLFQERELLSRASPALTSTPPFSRLRKAPTPSMVPRPTLMTPFISGVENPNPPLQRGRASMISSTVSRGDAESSTT